ncbi:ABC transporter substrate-binding protein [Rhodococcus sp. SJ-3]|uniref:ABC transporter substrate-binding protein n=1 Tax=Rhodococcus sp. SJ-3 TaxID=3454628 RepID=UPI003F79602E
MMIRPHFATTVLFTTLSVLLLTACGSSPSESPAPSVAGDPVPGGQLSVLQIGEPRTLDPAGLSNTWVHQPMLGNALYGNLMINDPDTNEIEYTMASGFDSTDGGTTYELTLRPGLMFTDDTPLDAAAVQFNWERLRDPALGSTAVRQASQIATTEVVDATTLKVVLHEPNPSFPQGMLATSMNWIASPAALEKGRAAFDEAPVGAGPFELTRWMRQGAIELERNPDYWDAPKPYLDAITIRSVSDTNQRVNAITTGDADLSAETNPSSITRAQNSGAQVSTVSAGGGQYLGMNFRRAPFDDVRARRAVALAVDRDMINSVVFNGDGEVPHTLFPADSPFYSDIPLPEQDKATAQALFDELAAEGKPVEFTFTTYTGVDNVATAESLQAQLGAYDNVSVEVEVVDFPTGAARAGAHDFDMMVSSAITQDPDYALWTAFHSESTGNFMGVSDPRLDEALDAGRTAETIDERTQAYEVVQQRITELHPGVWYVRSTPSVMMGEDVHGLRLYTLASPLPEELWIED